MMRKDIGVFPALLPMPVTMVAAYDAEGHVNVMNAAWVMITDENQITLSLASERKTLANMKEAGAFSVSIADVPHMDVADFWGIASGNKIPDKFERTGYHAHKGNHTNSPIIEEFPVTIECRLAEIVQTETLSVVVGTIVNVSVDEKVLDEKGKVDAAKVNPLIFDQFRHGYYAIGPKVGQAWNAGAALMKQAKAGD